MRMKVLTAATATAIIMGMTFTVYAEPNVIKNGEYIITEIRTQDEAIDIQEAPPINQISEALDVYVPDSDDDCPVSDKVPLSVEVQEYIWTKCKKATDDYENYYAFILGSIELESTFRDWVTHKNGNGTIDRGLMQINSSNISKMKKAGFIDCTDDLFNVQKNIDCGFWLMNQYIAKFGVTENAYYAYNTGRETGGSNKNSRIVMNNMKNWKKVVFGG